MLERSSSRLCRHVKCNVFKLPHAAFGELHQPLRAPGHSSADDAAVLSAAAAAVMSPLQQQPLPVEQQTVKMLEEQHASVLRLPHGLQPQQLPRHVALIMDGNSRWAAQQGLPAVVGHERGVVALKSAVVTAREWGIPALTSSKAFKLRIQAALVDRAAVVDLGHPLADWWASHASLIQWVGGRDPPLGTPTGRVVYAFSLENWQRGASEVQFLMNLFQSALQQQLPELQANGVQLRFIGQLHRLPNGLQQRIAACEAATAANTSLLLTVAVSYSAQEDMAQAVQQLVSKVEAGQLKRQQITPELIAQHLSSAAVTQAVGPPDLCIRTSGEQRMSNFMLFESAYTELCFLDVMWPAFSKEHFAAAVQQYAHRQRRYGRRM